MRLLVGIPAALVLLLPLVSRAADPKPVASKPEAYLLLPEPRAMRSSVSKSLADARGTVFAPAHSTASGSLSTYSAAEFARLGIGWDTFRERAETAADRLLAAKSPEWIKDGAGHVLYGVYRGDEEWITCLLIAPSLAQVFNKVFGGEIWVITPDRHSLYIFPGKGEALGDFAEDLRQRFQDAAFAASDEIFLRKAGGPLQAIGSLPK